MAMDPLTVPPISSTLEPGNYEGNAEATSEGESSEVEAGGYRTSLKDDLLADLEAITTPGSFAAFQALDEVPPAGLHIEDIGDVDMPLSEEVARQIIAQSRQAPFGKGSETIVDTSVRNTWELDASQFQFKNPAWPAFIQKLTATVALELGVQFPIRAEIYKMLLYEEGAMFKPHTDTQKIPGMFGTLVVCLPSAHRGGDVVLRHARQTKVYKSSDAAQSITCWYSDVSHEVLPITSGYRWVLTYNLAVDPATTCPTAGLQRTQTRGVRQTLKRWLSEDKASRSSRWLYHVLEHDYTQSRASLKALQRKDYAVAQLLREVSQELPVEIFIGLLEKEQVIAGEEEYDNGYGRYYDDDEAEDEEEEDEGYGGAGRDQSDPDVLECDHSVKTLVDLEGNVVSEGLQLDQNDVLRQDCFEDVEAAEEYEAFMGNEGGTTTQWYRTSAIVIVPHDTLASFFASATLDSHVNAQIGYVARRCLQTESTIRPLDALEAMCASVWGRTPRHKTQRLPYIDAVNMGMIIKTALRSGRYSFLETATAQHKGHLHTDIFGWIRRWLSDGGNMTQRFGLIQEGLSRAILAYAFAAERYQALAKLAPVPALAALPASALNSEGADTPKEIIAWVQERCCDQFVAVGEVDGSALVDLSFFFDDQLLFLEPRMTSVIMSQPINEAAYLGFIARLHDLSDKEFLPKEASRELYLKLATTFVETANFTRISGGPSAGYLDLVSSGFQTHAPEPSHFQAGSTVSPRLMNDLFHGILKSESTADLLTAFVARLIGAAPGIAAEQFELLWIPVLHDIVATLHASNQPLEDSRYQSLFASLLRAYLTSYVQLEPPTPGSIGLSRRGLLCSCADCAQLNGFLADPGIRVESFACGEQRRRHLSHELERAQVDCTHVTDHKRKGSSYRFVVTKTTTKAKHVHDLWKKRLARAAVVLAEFKQEDLQLILGSEYDAIMEGRFLRTSELLSPGPRRGRAEQQPSLLQQINANIMARPPPASAKRKRPATEPDFVDLTSD
ncbi:hypothetical protein HJFPF1_10927 [Paramyrothecium foliicola]|nr:hypothetical protein HJFPF1_10927 [Paramyrothecium foliicola]